jgi:glutathione-regulated potassium-efflux system protein KefB
MSIDVAALWQTPGRILLLVAGVLLLKIAVTYGLARAFGHDRSNAARLAVAVSQVGEFALVLFSAAATLGLVAPQEIRTLLLVVVLSMVIAPVLFSLAEGWLVPALAAEPPREYDHMEETAPIIVCGFGRFGQVVGRVLRMRGLPFTAMDNNAAQVEVLRRFGAKVFYGDPARHDLLLAAGAEQARILVITIPDVEASLKIVEVARRRFPHLRIFARARDRRHAHQLMDYDVEFIVRETYHSSLHLTQELLLALGLEGDDVRRTMSIFRDHDEQMLIDQHAFYDDEGQMIQTVRQAATELESLFRTDQESRRQAREEADRAAARDG